MDESALRLLNDPDWLRQKYVTEGLAQTDIAKLLGCNPSAVRLRLYRNGIPLRSRSSNALLHPRKWTDKQRSELAEQRIGAANPAFGKPGNRGANFSPDRREAVARYTRAMKYGITGDQYDSMFSRQGGLCAICGRPQRIERRGRIFPLAIDHDHVSGKVRGLLCHHCNIIIGMAEDNEDILRSAIRYLRRYRNIEGPNITDPRPVRDKSKNLLLREMTPRTHCVRGHELTPENTQNRGGHLVCKECRHLLSGSEKRHYPDRCTNGHPWQPETTYVNPKGRKVCLICKRLRWKRDHPIDHRRREFRTAI